MATTASPDCRLELTSFDRFSPPAVMFRPPPPAVPPTASLWPLDKPSPTPTSATKLDVLDGLIVRGVLDLHWKCPKLDGWQHFISSISPSQPRRPNRRYAVLFYIPGYWSCVPRIDGTGSVSHTSVAALAGGAVCHRIELHP